MAKSKQGSNYWSLLATHVHQGIVSLWQEDFGTDFEIVAGEKSFRCHKIVLAAMSDYFRALFNSGMKETEQEKVVFEDISSASFETIFKILYPTEPMHKRKHPLQNQSEHDVLELVKLGARFQMQFLTELCLEYLARTLSGDNCISRWKIGEEIQCPELAEMGRDFVRENFELMVPLRSLDSLDHDDFLNIVSDPHMHVRNEEITWKAIRNWVAFNEEERSGYIGELIKECCLTEIENSFLLEKITFDSLVRRNDEASRVVQDIVLYNNHPSLHSSIELKFRECHEKRQVNIVLYDDDYNMGTPALNKTLKVRSISPITNEIWNLKSSKSLKHPGRGFWNVSCCVYGQFIFVLNGNNRLESELLQYDGNTNTWQTMRSLEEPLIGHTMSAVDGCLYVAGGISGSHMNARVWKYYIDGDSWTEGGELMAPVVNASSVAYDKQMYIFGGTIDRDHPAECVQVYDTMNETATIISNLPKPCSFSRALLRQSTAYIVTSDGDIEKICLDTNEASLVAKIPLKNKQTFGINMRGDKLIVYTGRINRPREALHAEPGHSMDVSVARSESPELAGPREEVDLDDTTVDVKDYVVNVNTGDVDVQDTGVMRDCDVIGCVSLVVDTTKFNSK